MCLPAFTTELNIQGKRDGSLPPTSSTCAAHMHKHKYTHFKPDSLEWASSSAGCWQWVQWQMRLNIGICFDWQLWPHVLNLLVASCRLWSVYLWLVSPGSFTCFSELREVTLILLYVCGLNHIQSHSSKNDAYFLHCPCSEGRIEHLV